MKRNYIIPTTNSVAFHAGFVCQTASPAGGGMEINSNTDLNMGGNQGYIDPM